MPYNPEPHAFAPSTFGNCEMCGEEQNYAIHDVPTDAQLEEMIDRAVVADEIKRMSTYPSPLFPDEGMFTEGAHLTPEDCGCVPAVKVPVVTIIEAHTLFRIDEVLHQIAVDAVAHGYFTLCSPDTCGWVSSEWLTEGDARREYAEHLAELIAAHGK